MSVQPYGIRESSSLHFATGDRNKALELLREAVDTGRPVDLDDTDLSALRGDPEFEALENRRWAGSPSLSESAW